MNQDKIWKQKDLRMARMAGLKDATQFVTVCIQMEIFKPKDITEGYNEIKKYYKHIVDEIYNGMTEKEQETTEDIRQTNPATLKQMTYMEQLGIKFSRDITKEQASELIDKKLGESK